jgi:hypothetical protein
MLVKGDVDLIRHMASGLREFPAVVDLGAGSGTTALAVLAERPEARILTVDIDQDNLNWCQQAVANAFPLADWIGWHGRSSQPPEGIEPIDFLLIDAGHTYLDVMRDVLAWRGIAEVLWVHDYAPPPPDFGMGEDPYPGVRRAIEELTRGGIIERYRTDGMGWAGRYCAFD